MRGNLHNGVRLEHVAQLLRSTTGPSKTALQHQQAYPGLLHVLMTAANSLLWLFQLHPFPLPFTDRHFLMPDPTNQNFAILSGAECLSLEMSAVNLMGCHCINLVYLREQHRVLMRELNAT